MAQLVVRNLDDTVKERLRARARRHGHSLEQEVRDILADAVHPRPEPEHGLGTRIAARFAGIGLTEPIEELRNSPVRPATFEE